ncbi:MAG: adenosylmethionine decarboxylase [Crenarchaeota archaeon]|nr:adenosylmethionine decarboxylase [Thermoproteota archaeon]
MPNDFIVGKHVYGSLYGIPRELAENEEYLRELMKRAVEAAGATLVELKSWRIEGEKGGVSVIALVLESHLALHTWPNYDYATFDAYTCGDEADPWKAWDLILKELKPKYYTVHYTDRTDPLQSLSITSTCPN